MTTPMHCVCCDHLVLGDNDLREQYREGRMFELMWSAIGPFHGYDPSKSAICVTCMTAIGTIMEALPLDVISTENRCVLCRLGIGDQCLPLPIGVFSGNLYTPYFCPTHIPFAKHSLRCAYDARRIALGKEPG